MIEKQILRSIASASMDTPAKETVIVSQAILMEILCRLTMDEKINILKDYGLSKQNPDKELDGSWIKEARNILGITQETLAKMCDVNQCDVSYLENERALRIEGTKSRKKRITKKLEELLLQKLAS